MRAAFLGLCGVAVTMTAVGEDWYRWRGPHDNGISEESNWTAQWTDGKPRIAWSNEVGIGYSSCVTRENRVYTMGHIEDHTVVWCLHAENGQVLWRYSYAAELDARDFEGGSTSTPTLDDDRLYVLSRKGDLFCLDANSGAVRWRRAVADELGLRVPGWGCSAAPVITGRKLLLTLGESGVAVDKFDGSCIWSSADKDCGYATPVLLERQNGTSVIIPSGRQFAGVDLETGERQWTVRWLTSFGCNAADPIVHEGRMLLSSGYNRGSALFELVGGQPVEVWRSLELQNQLHTSLLHRGYLYGIDGNMEYQPKVTCLEWSTGKVAWSMAEADPGGMTLADGKLILVTRSGDLVVAPASPDGFHEIARGKVLTGTCWTVPILSGGRLYCRSVQGQLVCVDLRTGE